MPERKRVFIVVKTYPTISAKYAELVCTAGVLEDGSWIRLYPMPFRLLDDDQKYPKYAWVEVETERNTSDFRPESYRPDLGSMIVEQRPSKINWDERRKIIFKAKQVHTNLGALIAEAKSSAGTSLAVFKPAKILDFVIEPDDREWNSKNLASLRCQAQQMQIFKTTEEIKEELKVVPKVPYKFSYRFEDDSGKQSKLMITDWEIGMLYWNCLRRRKRDESAATADVKEKYLGFFHNRDLHFFLGTVKQYHNVAPNPFLIIGVCYPPMLPENKQMTLFDL